MNEDTRIVVTDLVFSVLSIVLNVYLLRVRGFGREDFDLRSAAIGAVETASHQYVAEHEPVASTLEDWPGEFAFVLFVVGSNRPLSRFVSSEESRGLGGGVGALCYRLVFGVVFDLPEGRRRRWLSRWRSALVSRVRSIVSR